METDWPRNYQKSILASRKHSTAPRWPPTLLYTLANRLYHDYDAVGVGEYVPHGGGLTRKMRRAMNNRSLSHHIRDENAARNGLTRTLKALALPCSGRREVSSRRAWRFNGLGITSGGR